MTGRDYEVVLTTYSGLVRYRYGDVVSMTGWNQGRPLLRFLYRLSTVIDLKGERMTESQIWAALCGMAEWWPRRIIDYALVHPVALGDASSLRYHVFIEFEQGQEEQKQQQQQQQDDAATLDQLLCQQNAGYRYHRSIGSISMCEIHRLSHGTFRKAFGILREMSPNVNQLKMPRLVRSPKLVELLTQSALN